uniref:Uncharacterized protein n=1 Tax=Oryza sativa subsp. japonica TaxID=39947 RepID=Q94LV5_ORYSJ|nr:hypothetical protein [Oryza sativa Japonica Group]
MYSPQPPSDGNPDDGALARPRRQLSTASAADSLAVFALAKLIDDRATHQADPQLALALAFAICARFQERSITFDSSSYHKLGDDSGYMRIDFVFHGFPTKGLMLIQKHSFDKSGHYPCY